MENESIEAATLHASPHQISFRVYYEDTDAGGIVYHANYLKFTERARTEWLRSFGINHQMLMQEHAIGMVVSKMNLKFIQPAHLDDELLVETQVIKSSPIRFTLVQEVKVKRALQSDSSNNELCFWSEVDVVVVTTGGDKSNGASEQSFRPARLPKVLYNTLLKN